MFAIGFFTLLIAGVGVANIMYVLVKERTREIGIKKAMGARNRHITMQFITESLLISFIGGGLGIAAATGMINGVLALNLTEGAGEFLGQPVLSLSVVATTVGVLSVIGFIAGGFPCAQSCKTGTRRVAQIRVKPPGTTGVARSTCILRILSDCKRNPYHPSRYLEITSPVRRHIYILRQHQGSQ